MACVRLAFLALLAACAVLGRVNAAAPEEADCPVCHSVMTRFTETLTKEDKQDLVIIEDKLQAFCDKMVEGKDAKFCYYITGATSLKRDISKPLNAGFPAGAICKKLGKRDTAICELSYKKVYKFNLAELTEEEIARKRIKDLRAIMQERSKVCVGCLEKPDFVAEVIKLKVAEASAKSEL